MAFTMALWKVDQDNPVAVAKATLDIEKRLEDWIAKDHSILGLDLLFVGRQIQTAYGGFIDLLAVDDNANAVIVELKRDKTPRDIVAQVLDYASWVKVLTAADLDNICQKYNGKSLAQAFQDRFGVSLPDTVNTTHSMAIAASELDDSSERIVRYLEEDYGININVVFFEFFKVDGSEILARSWLIDPEQAAERSETRKQIPWSGYWFVNVGEPSRDWEDCRNFGFVSAGGGPQWSKKLQRLSPGDRIFAYVSNQSTKQRGYVGYGVVLADSTMFKDFVVDADGKRLFDEPLKQQLDPGCKDDPETSEYAVKVKWIKTYGKNEAKWFKSAFANQHIVCKLRHAATVDYLKEQFNVEDISVSAST